MSMKNSKSLLLKRIALRALKNQVLDLFLAIGSDLMTLEVIRAKMQIWPHVQILVTNSETPFPALLGSYAKYILRINCVF